MRPRLQSPPVLRRAVLAAAVAVLAVLVAPAQAADAPRIDVPYWYLVGEDGTVLSERSARHPRAIASITKLMTALVTLEHADPKEVVRVSPAVARVGGSTIFLRGGEEISVAELVRATLIPSANDAATALALYVGNGSIPRFVELMNEKARELRLADTFFENPHGLDAPAHLSSAHDATLLVRQALGNPLLRGALSQTAYTGPDGRIFPSSDDLNGSWPPLVGAKTGHTLNAGWSEAGAARGRGITVYGTVLGGGSRAERNSALRRLLTFGLAQYRRVAAIDASRVYATAETGYGRPAVDLVAPRTLTATVHETAALVERVIAPVEAGLPIRKGQRLGSVELWDGNRLLVSSDLVAAADVAEPGVVRKALWFAGRTAANFWGLLS